MVSRGLGVIALSYLVGCSTQHDSLDQAGSYPGAPQLALYGYYRDNGLLSEVSDHANLTFIMPGSAEDGVPTAATLAEAESRGMKGMLDLQAVFGIHADGSMRDTAEWQAKWNTYSSNVAQYVQRGVVAGFYMYDEPDPNATPAFWSSLEFAASVVRNRFPGVPIAMGYGWWNLHFPEMFVVPSGFDWFGFNCYGPFDSCMTTDGSGPRVEDLFARLESGLSPGQRVMLDPEASNFFNIALSVPYNENDYTSRLDRYMQLAALHPSVVAIVPFLWKGQFGPTYNPAELGLRDMSAATRDRFAQVGRAITGKGGSQPPPTSDRLTSGQALAPNQYLASGDTQLYFQGDGNLVLYRSGTPIWATYAFGPPSQFVMQGDCNAVAYATNGVLWASGTNGAGSNCEVRVVPGDWLVCAGTATLFSATGAASCGSAYQGCYTDDATRALPAAQGGGFDDTTCRARCRGLGYAYAGTQWYGECYCGNTRAYTRVGDGECNTQCSANPAQTCGGAWRNSIYTSAQ